MSDDYKDRLDRMWDKIGHDLGWHDHSMRRDRPYTGQPHTSTGIRGSTQIQGITFRDLRDAFVRAWIKSHPCYKSGTITPIQPNHTLYNEADKGENAALCEQDVYQLQGNVDPIAVVQNLGCEIEKLMGIYPNVPPLETKGNDNGV